MEGAEILYDSNVFVFDAAHYRGYSLEESHDHIPTMPSLECVSLSPSEETVLEDVNRIFDMKTRQPRLIWQDPMLRFFNTIGPRNTALLKSLKLSGAFCNEDGTHWRYDQSHKFQSMVEYLPIYTCVLKNACHGLRSIYLDGEVTLRGLHVSGDDSEETDSVTAHEILNDCIGKFVEGLPQLTKFHLGWSGDLHGDQELTWNYSECEKQRQKWGEAALDWTGLVEGRSETSTLAEGGHVEQSDIASEMLKPEDVKAQKANGKSMDSSDRARSATSSEDQSS
jgi:hypothetical protein